MDSGTPTRAQSASPYDRPDGRTVRSEARDPEASQAEEYARLRDPFLINDVSMQHALLDRREMYKVCMAHNIPVPRFAVISR